MQIMDEPTDCAICEGCGWVCENHELRPWGGESNSAAACDCGAGMPCTCNPDAQLSAGSQIICSAGDPRH